MKCNHCKAEWTAPNSNKTTCPFCDRPLVEEIKLDGLLPPDILKHIFTKYGEATFTDPVKLSGMLADMLVNNPKILKLYCLAVREQIPNKLLASKHLDASGKELKIRSLKVSFEEDNYLKDLAANYVIDSFAYALGINEIITIRYSEFKDAQGNSLGCIKPIAGDRYQVLVEEKTAIQISKGFVNFNPKKAIIAFSNQKELDMFIEIFGSPEHGKELKGLGGKMIVTESLSPQYEGHNPKGEILLTANGDRIYRQTIFTQDSNAVDVFIENVSTKVNTVGLATSVDNSTGISSCINCEM